MESVNNSTHDRRQLSLSTLEKAVVGFFSTLCFTMLAWVTVTTNQTATKVAVMESSIEYIKEDARRASLDRFTGTQGKDLERRIAALESRLNK